MNDKWMIYLGAGMGAAIALLLIFGQKSEKEAAAPDPPKPAVEEKAAQVPDEPSAWQRQQAQLRTGIEAHRQAAEEEARMAQLVEEYKHEQAARAAAEAAKEKAEREYWEDRKDWVENFPFKHSAQGREVECTG